MDLTLETTQFSAVTYVDKGATQEKVQKCKNAKAIKWKDVHACQHVAQKGMQETRHDTAMQQILEK